MRIISGILLAIVLWGSGCFPSPAKVIEAYHNGDLQSAYDYVAGGGNVNIQDKRKGRTNSTLLMLAIDKRDDRLINMILDHPKFNVEKEKAKEFNALHMVAARDDIDTLKRLVPLFEDLNQNSSGWTPLCYAVKQDALRAAAYLLEQPGVLVDYYGSDPYRLTPLMVGAFNGLPEMVKLLLENGADPHLKNTEGENALEIAQRAFKKYMKRNKDTAKPEHIDEYERTIAILEEATSR